ncbi:Glycosyltransferase involved in cell wall bisynthesis [Desulfomicrobium apsheronum]|uniref:Glycosyltransferase involved in cell wall bisynthesis n=1 Tax=Desulfomicrobium apsheronum TaxID=52560 RepID=A0A1I3VR26_9BACT|nr:glycosyltransferase [Desulfomicrobium apsheronum]SFJ97695.1 Glycosyltransferase involved in cell wall bisynthesis [Desulfomicrobium apsheronum]
MKISQVQLAFSAYSTGNYAEALRIYSLLAQKLGLHLFKANIELCNRRMGKKSDILQNGIDVCYTVEIQDAIISEHEDFTSFEFFVLGERLVCEFNVLSENPYAHNQMIFGIDFLDAQRRSLESESYELLNYSESKTYGRYRYLSATCDGLKYLFSLLIPVCAVRCVVKIGNRKFAKTKLVGNPSFNFYNGKSGCDIVNVLTSDLCGGCIEDVHQVLDSVGFNVSYVSDVVRAIISLPATEVFSATVFWYLWRLSNDNYLFELARQRLVFNGRMYETRQLLNEWDASVRYRNSKYSSRRVDDEIRLLENGISLPQRVKKQAYEPSKNVLYLLHNRLPYNSGGYATRTHGLLTGIEKNSHYKMQGVSRPGYPTDHAKYISKLLPSPIPSVDVVDGIEYFALNQNVRRSSMTITEYVEKYAQEVEALARRKKTGIIHAAANFPNGLAASLAARRLGIKSVYEVRGLWEITRLSRQEGWNETDQFRFMARMEAEACKAADEVITITEALKDMMVARGVDSSKITVVPNCVHTNIFSPLEKDQSLAKELGLADEDVVIGYIGSMVNYEGLDDLLDTLKLLLLDGIQNFKVLLVGDGCVLNDLQHQVVNLCLEKHVIITGRVPHDDVQRYYSLVDITPFPRKPYLVCEAVSPLKPFEAMASQKAVIVSSCAALTEIIKDGYNGLVFEKGSVASFKDTLKKLIVDNNLRKQLAINGREWVVQKRDWSTSSKKLITVYDSLV